MTHARMLATAAVVALALPLGGCEWIDKARMKVFGITVCNPDQETAEWVLREVLLAAAEKDEDKGFSRLQKVLHTAERTTNSLKDWAAFKYPRMRRQANLYLDDAGCFTVVDFRTMQNEGIEYFVQNRFRDLPTPCTVYTDHDNNGLWRIKRCSL
jgi:hypothetical protein